MMMFKTSIRLRVAAGIVTLAFAVVAALIIVVVQQRGSSSEATIEQVVQRTMARESALAASITAGTTLHEVVIVHYTPAQVALNNNEPADQRSEGWWAFGPDGALTAYYAENRDIATGALTGVHQLMPDGSLKVTSYPSGKVQTFANYNQLTASAVAANVQSQADMARDALTAPGMATRALVVGGNYEIDTPDQHRFVDSTYRLVRTEDINSDGSPGQVTDYPTFEVQSGNTVPTPPAAPTPTTPLSTPTPTSTATPPTPVPSP